MVILQYCKTQIMCLLIMVYISVLYVREEKNLNKLTKKKDSNNLFFLMMIVSELGVIFDGITACTVNFLEQVPILVNLLVHLGMLVMYDVFAALLFLYWVYKIIGRPKYIWKRILYILPCIISLFFVILNIPNLEFLQGKYTNYSMGVSVYISFFTVALYCVLTIAVIIIKHRFITKNKKRGLSATLVFVSIIMGLQIIFPEALISCMAAMMVVISIYVNMENPAIHGLEHYHHEMVMGFATLVENKDDNTGGHIRRSSAYAVLIAQNLRKNKKYKNRISKDYIDNLAQSAPMHDIGKIGIPDAILQKPGRLTNEEFDTMKQHPVIGGKIIKDTFGHLYNGEYESMAYFVAMHHHEKWNGKGYPEGLSGEDIPLCARIMAVADVFDAVSAKRCYRDALPLEECYNIILNGRGVDFDPDIVDAFMMDREKIENIYNSNVHF